MKLAYTISASTTRFAAVGQTGDLAGALRFLAGLGFDGVELAIRDPSLVSVDAISDTARALGVSVPAIGTGQAYVEEGLALTAPPEVVRERAVERLLAQVPVAARLGALLIIGLIHGPIPPDEPRARAEEWFLSGLGRVAQAARQRGVRLVVEPINRYESNWLNTVGEVMDLLARLGEDNVGVLPDTFHMNIEEPDPAAALRALGPRLWHVHVADSNRRAPGLGHLDFKRFVNILGGLGYGGFVSAEILQHPTFEEAARQTIAAMRPLVLPAAR
ncbi:MAG TPA: 5-keto-L-gluconate epimerase [bacterium]|nr:5-keto-L-gluconate epimerase [bacterium]